MKKVLAAVLGWLVVLGGPVLAQYNAGGKPKSLMELEYDEQVKRRTQADKDYEATMRRLRDSDRGAAQQPADPWGNVRAQPQQAGSGKK